MEIERGMKISMSGFEYKAVSWSDGEVTVKTADDTHAIVSEADFWKGRSEYLEEDFLNAHRWMMLYKKRLKAIGELCRNPEMVGRINANDISLHWIRRVSIEKVLSSGEKDYE